MIYAASLLFVIVTTSAVARAQPDLDKLDEKLTRHIEKAMPGWTHERDEPVVKTENVLIHFWRSPEKSVKISVMPYRSGGEAKAAFEEFVKYA